MDKAEELIERFDALATDFGATRIVGRERRRIAHMSDPGRFKNVPCISLNEDSLLFCGQYNCSTGEICRIDGEFVQIDDPIANDILMSFYWLYGASQAKL